MAKAIILKGLLDKLNVSLNKFEEEIGVSNGAVRKSIARNGDLSSQIIGKIVSKYPHVNHNWLLTGEGNMFLSEENINPNIPKRNDSDEQFIYIPFSERPVYLNSLNDKTLLSRLPKINLPGLPYKPDKHRVFQVGDDSMAYLDEKRKDEPENLIEGESVVAQEISKEHWSKFSNNYIYVVVTADRIYIKWVVLKEDKKSFVLISNNEFHPQFILNKDDIKELWLVKQMLKLKNVTPKKIDLTI